MGVGKSWITSAYVLWRLYRDPDYKALVVSASKARSDEFTTFTKRLINEVPFPQYLTVRDDQRDSMIAFHVSAQLFAPTIATRNIEGRKSTQVARFQEEPQLATLNNLFDV